MLKLTFKFPALCTIAMLSGCAALDGTRFAEQSTESLNSISEWQQQIPSASEKTYLTDLIHSEALEVLIQQGLSNNPGLQQTALAIQIARENVANVRGDQLPQASLSVSQNNTEGSDAVYQSSLDVSWTLDWLQKLQDSADASQAGLASSIAADQYARDLLASSIIDIWFQLVQQSQLIDIERTRLRVLEQNEQTIVERYRKGLDELTDLDSARSQSASSRATLVAYLQGHKTLQRSMAALLGKTEYSSPESISFPQVQIPLASVPAQDLGRRPDLQQAYLNIRIADLNSAVAYKNLLPSLSLGLSLSQSNSALRDALFTSPAWSVLNQLTIPLFQGGSLRAQARQADLTAEQTYWAYQEKLLAAVQEVENALGQENALSAQQAHISDALNNAERSFETYQTKYRQGLVTFLDLLTIQTQTFDLRVQKTQLTYARLSNRITLGLALGLGVKS
ncbi:TolC family protein [Aliamphritea hakodatensis]|uniref:TolC family protein n=1 Tax=Aliamphritea hakodatensis TaxID=2895352 RepID=UPI0022FD68A7|nr:TolC family protein [Aliamphritea hakodatensis]